MSEVKVNKISPRSGTSVTLGESPDVFNVPTGVTLNINAGATLVNNGTATGLSSPEVYGFSKNASGQLLITTTSGGTQNISKSTYASFDDALFAGTGFVWSINSDGDLIATI
jgi:hypothetical protein|tara:strand:+ start:114 stop:449 length:336 start_codon:yes stop_codon:yes gene_type:complete